MKFAQNLDISSGDITAEIGLTNLVPLPYHILGNCVIIPFAALMVGKFVSRLIDSPVLWISHCHSRRLPWLLCMLALWQ